MSIETREQALQVTAIAMTEQGLSEGQVVDFMQQAYGVTIDANFAREAIHRNNLGEFTPTVHSGGQDDALRDLTLQVSEDALGFLGNHPGRYQNTEESSEYFAAKRRAAKTAHARGEDDYDHAVLSEHRRAMQSGNFDYANQLEREMRQEGIAIPEYNEE